MAVISGYIALGSEFYSGVFHEVSGGTYAREAVALTGTAAAGLNQSMTSIGAATLPANAPIRLGAIFDALTGGNMLMWWEWATLPLTPVGTAFPPTTLNITLYGNIAAEMFQNGGAIDPGAMIGFANGAPLVAGNRLLIQGGNLQFEGASARQHESPLFMVGGVNVGKFDANGNLLIKGAVTPNATGL